MIPIYQDVLAFQQTFVICLHPTAFSQFIDDYILQCPTDTEITLYWEDCLIFHGRKFGHDCFLFLDNDHDSEEQDILISYGTVLQDGTDDIYHEGKGDIYMDSQELKKFILCKEFLKSSTMCDLFLNGIHLTINTDPKTTKEFIFDAQHELHGKIVVGWLQMKRVRSNIIKGNTLKGIIHDVWNLFK